MPYVSRTIAMLMLYLLCTPFLLSQERNSKIDKLLKNQVQQVKVGNCDHSSNPTLFYKQMIMVSTPNGVIDFSGTSTGGKPWKAELSISPIARCEVWTTAISSERIPIIFIIAWGLDSSGGWDTTLTTLLFNEHGEPTPWQAISNFNVNEHGIEEVIQAPASDTMSILIATREGMIYSGFTYIYDLYDVMGDRVQSVTKSRYGVQWPLLPEGRADVKAHHVIDALSTVGSIANTELSDLPSRVKLLSRDPGNHLQIQLEDGRIFGVPQILMRDTASSGRTILFAPTEVDLRKLTNAKASVRLIGKHCDWTICTPLVLKAYD